MVQIDTPLNERNARLLMMVLLLHHKGAAKIGEVVEEDFTAFVGRPNKRPRTNCSEANEFVKRKNNIAMYPF
ncbi:hypothetical protein HID58_025624 [Brassica napus]|uniref:Uncharacterized protein n=1 Tax=Brassica napus TaxID=3708 RepID=A0ABQ8CLM0_BRANA|nr:hypothetical protein HID58_025624 [Brassica napus]